MQTKLFAFFAVILLMVNASAATIEQPLPNVAQEQQARAIFRVLKCVVCEGQALADSDAALAIQMRARIREMVADGQTTTQILDYFRSRYGARILLTPPVERATYLLWTAPLILLLLGAALLRRMTRKEPA